MLTLNRRQNELRLLFFDVNTGGMREVLRDSSSAWIDVYDFYAGVQDLMTFPANAREFFWVSDRDGQQHIYRYDYSGKLIRQVTSGPWSVTRIEGVDPASRTIYFTGTNPSPLERQLWSVKFDGSALRRITTAPGTHTIDMAPNAKYFIDSWSSTTRPRQVELWSTGDAGTGAPRKLRTLETNEATTQWLATHEYAPTELITFTTSDGVTLDASVIKPVPFDPAQEVPGRVRDLRRPGRAGRLRPLRRERLGAVARPARLRRRQREQPRHEQLRPRLHEGRLQEPRQVRGDGLRGDGAVPQDAAVGRRRPHRHHGDELRRLQHAVRDGAVPRPLLGVGIANSGVTDWRLYDTIYTERYMSTLDDNRAGYEQSSAIVNAPKLRGKLLVIHAMLDDNVHPQHTMQLLTALTAAGQERRAEDLPAGAARVGVRPHSARLIAEAQFEFLERNLKAPRAVQ